MNRKAKKAETNYLKKTEALRDFEDGTSEYMCPHCGKNLEVDNDTILETYRHLALEREVARTRAIEIAREEGEEICGMQISKGIRREYDGETLYRYLEHDPELRDKIVKVKYSVSSDMFDRAVVSGKIPEKMKKKILKKEETTISVRKKPAEIKLG